MDTELGPAKSVQDTSIQCELLLDGLHGPTNEFSIPNLKLRRRLVRRFYGLLMTALTIPCLEILLLFPELQKELSIRVITFISLLIIYTGLYMWPKWRRTPPYNYLIFIFTSLTTPFSKSLYLAHLGRTRWLHAYPLVIITELLALIMFSKQQKFRFTHGTGVIIIYLVYGLLLVGAFFLNAFVVLLSVAASTLEAWYIIYDTILMLHGQHGYNVGPQEYMFAASNIHADLPKFFWIIIWHFMLGPIRGCFKLVRYCRTTEVC